MALVWLREASGKGTEVRFGGRDLESCFGPVAFEILLDHQRVGRECLLLA